MEEERLESISNLPDEILLRIVSLVPLKEAVGTSILLAAWRSLWNPFRAELEFDSNQITSHESETKLSKFMAMLLRYCDSSELWKLSLRVHRKEEDGLETKEDLIFSATKGVVKELHLDFSRGKQTKNTFNLISQPCPSSFNCFSSLKTLHLRAINQFAEKLVSNLFSNCEFLESLKLEKCTGLQSINVEGRNFLRSFEMVDCPSIVSISVSALNPKSFLYRGVLPQVHINSSQNLVDVTLDLREGLGKNGFDCEDVLSLLASLKDIEILMMSGWLLELFTLNS